MATAKKNLSDLELVKLNNPSKIKIGIVVSEWNKTITERLTKGAIEALNENKIPEENIVIHKVPGTFELPLGAQYLLENNLVHGVITIGCVIQGETKHFDYVCQGATNGIAQVGLRYNKPVTFCVLTDENEQQSIDRSGGKHGNKGIECAISCLKMIHLKDEVKKPSSNIGF
ncbi:MAG: 6,7-dimethyl-8-ribityllumazine synthase [Crocinitomicaceae bacterium]|nr:6,7-dimethyl-8-ribityllumazine synthase [Crocinitomicaceae bacterium]|tara:strand:- start:1721 stop:2236 length:516 start_codon:yes stop_codon:yes gene_type:complete